MEDFFYRYCKKKGCYGIITFVISPWWKCLNVIMDIWRFQRIVLKVKKCFSEQREAEPTNTISPYVPICLCAALAYTSLELVRKWRTPWVSKENRVTVCKTADAPVSFQSDVWKHFGFPPVSGNDKEDKATDRRKTTQIAGLMRNNTLLGHFFVHNVASKVFQVFICLWLDVWWRQFSTLCTTVSPYSLALLLNLRFRVQACLYM